MSLYTAETIRNIACGDAIVAIVKKTTPGYDWVHRELMREGQRLSGKICPNATPSIPEELTALVEHNGGFTAAEACIYGVDVDSLIRSLAAELETSLNVRLVQRKDIDEYTMLILCYPQPHCLDAFVIDRAASHCEAETNPIDKLESLLNEAGIPFKRFKEKYTEEIQDDYKSLFGERAVWLRNQIIYGEDIEAGWWILSAIWHAGSYGEPDELECYGTMIPDPTALSPEEVFEIIKKDWEKTK